MKSSEALEEAKLLMRQAEHYVRIAECAKTDDERNRFLKYAIKTLSPWPILMLMAIFGED